MRHLTNIASACIIILASFVLRIWNLNLHALSGDEAFTVVTWVPASPYDLLHTIGTIDPQPPIALLSTVFWLNQAGTSEFAARLYSVFSSLIFTATVYAITNHLFHTRIALLATLCATLNPYHLWLSQDIRPYAPWMAASALSTLTLLNIITHRSHKTHSYLYYAAASLLALGMFYFQVLNFIAHNLTALIWLPKSKRNLIHWSGVQLFLLGSLLFFLALTDLLTGVYKPTASHVNILDVFYPLILGETWPYPSIILTVIMTIIPFLAFALLVRQRPSNLQLLTLTITPILCLGGVTLLTNQPYFRARYLSALIGPLSILIAAAIWYVATKLHSLRLIPLATLLTISLIAITNYHFNPLFAKAPDWRTIMKLLDDNADTPDIVIQNYPDPAFTYYYQGNADTVVLPSSENPDASITIKALRTQVDTHRYVWFFPTPNSAWDRDQVVATWLQDQLPLLNEFWVRNTHILAYAPSTPSTTDIMQPLVVEYANILRTDGWRISPRTTVLRPNSTLSLELFYHPIQPTTQQLTFFVHLVLTTDPSTPLTAQSDHPPQHRQDVPTTWRPNMLLRDVFTLIIPPNTPDGQYTVIFGLYDPKTNERLIPSPNSQSPSINSTVITTITIHNNKKRDAP